MYKNIVMLSGWVLHTWQKIGVNVASHFRSFLTRNTLALLWLFVPGKRVLAIKHFGKKSADS